MSASTLTSFVFSTTIMKKEGIFMDIKKNVKNCGIISKIRLNRKKLQRVLVMPMEGFEYDPATLDDKMIDSLSDDAARALFFDIGFMAVNELFGGDFGTWYEVLEYGLGFDAETIDLLEF